MGKIYAQLQLSTYVPHAEKKKDISAVIEQNMEPV